MVVVPAPLLKVKMGGWPGRMIVPVEGPWPQRPPTRMMPAAKCLMDLDLRERVAACQCRTCDLAPHTGAAIRLQGMDLLLAPIAIVALILHVRHTIRELTELFKS